MTYWLNLVDCCLTDGSDVLYNKFNVDSSFPVSPPPYPYPDYNCVVATSGQWRVSHCDQQHCVVCQSHHDTLTGIMTRSQVLWRPVYTYAFYLSPYADTHVSAYTHASSPSSLSPSLIFSYSFTTLCLKKGPTFKLSVTLSNLIRFSKFLHYWKAYKIRYKTDTTLPTSP